MALVCEKCSNSIENREFLICSSCKLTFHLDCCNVSSKRFYLMEKEKKGTWKCISCFAKQTPLSENVTVRTKYTAVISTENSFEALSSLSGNEDNNVDDYDDDLEQTSFLTTSEHNRSCPERTMIYDKAEKMEKLILELQEKLQIADNEIVNLLSENYTLKDKIKSQAVVISSLKKVSGSTVRNNSIKNIRKSKAQNQSYINLSGDQTNLNLQNTSNDISTTIANHERNHKPMHIQTPIGMSTPTTQPSTSRLQPLPSSAPYKTKTSTTQPKKPTIYIFGDEQVRGLSQSLLNSRKGKWNDVYDVRAVVKPYASSSQIVNDLTNMANIITKHDLIVFSVGCNDKNPFTLLTNICNILHNFRNNDILLFNIRNNKHLNINALNYNLEKFTKNYSNCTLINIRDKGLSLRSMVFKLNVEIDFLNYRREFIENGIKSRKLHKPTPTANSNKNDTFFRPQRKYSDSTNL